MEQLVTRAKELGMKALALTDIGNMFAAVEFTKCCKKNGIKPIIGQEFYVQGLDLADFKREYYYKTYPDSLFRLVLLCENETGYKNLVKLSSLSYEKFSDGKPFIEDTGILKDYAEGLICLSGGMQSRLVQGIISGSDSCDFAVNSRYYMFNKDHYYNEIQIYGDEKSKLIAKEIYKLSQQNLVATNTVYYCNSEDADAFSMRYQTFANKFNDIATPH